MILLLFSINLVCIVLKREFRLGKADELMFKIKRGEFNEELIIMS